MTNQDQSPRYIDAADVAKLIRADLKAVFPGVKFSVKTSKYAGGASVRVRWTDGPTGAQVEALTNRYQACDFDGMTDSKSYRRTTLNGEPVMFGSTFTFVNRDVTPELRAKVEGREPVWADSVDQMFREEHLRRSLQRWSCCPAVGEPVNVVTVS